MIRWMLFCAGAVSGALLLCSPLHAQSVRSLVNGGNDLYAEKNYTEAEVNYRKALEKDITSVAGHYNLGNALYKQEKLDEAIKSYEDAVRTSQTPTTKAKAYYNLGDAYIKSQKYEEAIKALTESLKLNPQDFDAKYNLSYALKKLREQQQHQKNDKKQQDKHQDQQKQQNDQNTQDQHKPEQQQQNQEQNKEQHRQQQPKPQERMMTRADAERILDVLKDSEKEVQKKLRQRVAGRPKTEKDW